jgi:spore coat polysaccharide biosynthesis predicted glycosyltransferase SpsG
MNVLIHADGGPGVGMGHVARCTSLANALSRRGHKAVVAVDPSCDLVAHVEKLGAMVMTSGAAAYQVSAAARAIEAEIVVVDSYRWSGDDFVAARGGWSLLAFDDEANRELPVEAVINGAPNAAELRYQTATHTCLWLGPTYQIVRDDFRLIPLRGEAGVLNRVIVLVGGDDPMGLLPILGRTLQTVADNAATPFKAELICGPFTPLPALTGLSNVVALRNPVDLRERMARADLAISAAGQTLYELARCGTPAIAFCSGQDQVHNLAALAVREVIWDAGDATRPEWLQKIRNGLVLLTDDAARRTAMSRAGQSLIDGLGADRLVEAIERLVAPGRFSATSEGVCC